VTVTGRVRAPRRVDALSRERVVAASIELLDTAGEDGLTVRALTAHLSTGRGAIYHHVVGKDDLLTAATDAVIGDLVATAGDGDPRETLRSIAVGIFDTIDAHPWVGGQLTRHPQPAVFRLWNSIGASLSELGVAGTDLADAGSALVSYVLGASAQYAAGARQAVDPVAREKYLQQLATQWPGSGCDGGPGQAAELLTDHDDRDQFLAGVDIFLAGVLARLRVKMD